MMPTTRPFFLLRTSYTSRAWCCALLTFGLLLVASCSKNELREVRGSLDTPEHHALRGEDALERNQWRRAENAFMLSLGIAPKHAPSLAGLAVAKAGLATDALSPKEKKSLHQQAFDALDDAEDEASSKTERYTVYTQGIRVHSLSRSPPKKWLQEAQDFYAKAGRLAAPNEVRHHLNIARAYRVSFDLPKAETAYRKVLAVSTPYAQIAENELAVVQRVRRAAPGALHGKKVAFLSELSRADTAALLIEELRLSRLYRLRNANRKVVVPKVRDLRSHPLRADIEALLHLGVRGLELDSSDRFHPDSIITRAEFAVVIEDVLSVVTGEKNLKTRFIGQKSPFADIRGDAPHYNAVQTVVSRGLLAPLHKISGHFGPKEPLSGVDALLSIRLIKDALRSLSRG